MAETFEEMQKRKRKNPNSWTKADQKKLLQRQIDRRKSKPTASKPLNLYQRQLDKMKRLKTEAAAKKRKATEPQTKTPTIIKSKQLSASDKRKIATEKRDAQSRLKLQQQIKDLKRKGQDVKARKASERLEDIPPVSKPKKKIPSGDKPGMRIGSQAAVPYSRLLNEKGRKVKKTRKGTGFDKTAVAPSKVQAKPKPVSKVVPKKVEKPKTKDMSVWETIKQGWKNLQADPRSRSQQVQQSTAAALNKKMKEAPAYVKRMKEYKQIGDMLKARQAKPTGKDIASGKDAEARRKAAKAKQQASRTKTRTGTFKDLYQRQPKKPATAVSKARTFKDPYEKQKDRKLGTAVPVKIPVSKKVDKPISKVVPKKFAKITPRRKPIPPKTKTFTDPYKEQKDRKLGTGIPSISKGTSTAMSDRPEGRRSRTIAEDKADFLKSKGGTDEDLNKGFGFNLFGKNKSAAEAKKAGDEAYLAEQEDRKKASQQDFYQYGEGRRSKLKKGGRVGKKKQGYKARKDESIAMRVKKKRTKKQLKVSRSDSYGKFGSGKGKGKINRSGAALVAASYD
mgnify:CR=1 FL=1